MIQEFGLKHIASTVDRVREHKLLATLLEGANAAIRAKYPEEDMAVLRKYKLQRVDRCLKFQFPSGRVDGFTFASEDGLADLPYRAGCGYFSNDVFAVTTAFEKAIDEYAKLKDQNDKSEREKVTQFHGFLAVCQTLDEVLDVIPLPDDIKKRLGHNSTALVAVTPETVKSLKATFKKAA
ncbi:MAG: hypothetical protein U0835_00495 [Isosphaeraceae bacterium]